MSLLCINLLLGLGLRLFNTLIIDGDVENSPDSTYAIEKAIYGSYHQGDSMIQQVSNVHVILCMHYAGNKSDRLYKTLNTLDMLSVYGLPCFVVIFMSYLQLEVYQYILAVQG